MNINGEKKLAMAVIGTAIEDITSTDKNVVAECYDFLTGKTDTAKYWFDLCGYKPLSGTLAEVKDRIGAVKAVFAV